MALSDSMDSKTVSNNLLRANSIETETPTLERKSKFSVLSLLFKPWKWKKRKRSDRFHALSKSLERQTSIKNARDKIVQKDASASEDNDMGNICICMRFFFTKWLFLKLFF